MEQRKYIDQTGFFSARRRGLIMCFKTFARHCSTSCKYGHIIYQNDPIAKPDLMVMVPDLYCQRSRRQARRRLPSLPLEPQGHLENAFYVPTQFTNCATLLNTASTNTFSHINLYIPYTLLGVDFVVTWAHIPLERSPCQADLAWLVFNPTVAWYVHGLLIKD